MIELSQVVTILLLKSKQQSKFTHHMFADHIAGTANMGDNFNFVYIFPISL